MMIRLPKFFLPALVGLLLTCHAHAQQTPYLFVTDPEHPNEQMALGIFSPYLLKNNDQFTWYQSSFNGYTPDSSLVQNLNKSKSVSGISLLVFGGTWCDDTRFILPKFFRCVQESGFPDDRISLFGVDRNKLIPGNLTNVLDVKNVPTIIVIKNGKEIGRVVEYGKTGKWDTELADIIKTTLP